MELRVFLFALLTFTPILCQENAGTGVATSLLMCYNASAIPGVLTANGRPPASLNILLEYIRRLEDANPTMSAQQLSLQLLHRFKQDGIRRTGHTILDARFGVPFSPARLEAYKYRTILHYLIPNVEQSLSNGDLNDLERCSLHYMVSSTIDMSVRGDESSVCARTSRYTSRILRRKRDVELVNPNQDEFGVLTVRSLSTRNISQCPLELGVIFTNYGTIKAGSVLAGIAAGMNQQSYLDIDNRFASTVAGELAEASLYQANETVSVGASGGWNSTVNPRYFFLQKNNYLQATDAEIRGSLDGLFMGLQMDSWRSTFSDIKISQILDMYYSPYQKGVFDSTFRACNRNILYTEMTSRETLTNQVKYFMPLLNTLAQFGPTLTNESFEVFAEAGISAFDSYLPQMNTTDLNCQPESTIERVAADVLIFIDSSWSYTTVQPVLSYVLDNIDVNKFGTKYTVFSGSDCLNITTNGSSYLSDFHQQYNLTVHQNQTSGFNYNTVFETLENITQGKLTNNSYTGGDSTIVLLVPRSTMSEDQRTFLTERRQIIRQTTPDVNILVLGTGSQNDYSAIVTNPSKDVVILSETTNEETLKQIGQDVVSSIKNVPRSVMNPNCGVTYTATSSSFSLTQYVELRGVNYYRVSPNYFYNGGDTRNLKVRELSYGTINICVSRDQSKPDNQTSQCDQIRGAEKTIDITGYCDGYSVSECPPIYVAISGNASDTKCSDTLCRFPNDIKYTITMENVGCASGSIQNLGSFILVLVAVFYLMLN